MKVNYPRIIYIDCPLCSRTNKVRVDYSDWEYRPQIVVCDSEEGGCDEAFAVQVDLKPMIKTYKLVDPE